MILHETHTRSLPYQNLHGGTGKTTVGGKDVRELKSKAAPKITPESDAGDNAGRAITFVPGALRLPSFCASSKKLAFLDDPEQKTSAPDPTAKTYTV